jgi:hypothetical protein
MNCFYSFCLNFLMSYDFHFLINSQNSNEHNFHQRTILIASINILVAVFKLANLNCVLTFLSINNFYCKSLTTSTPNTSAVALAWGVLIRGSDLAQDWKAISHFS